MLRLNKKSEYGLMALVSLSEQRPGECASVPRLAAKNELPKGLLAKVMQDLKRAGLVSSTQGAGGGYRLAKPLAQISLLDVVQLFEEGFGLVECLVPDGSGCSRCDHCTLKDPMTALNALIMRQLGCISLASLTSLPIHAPQSPDPPISPLLAVGEEAAHPTQH